MRKALVVATVLLLTVAAFSFSGCVGTPVPGKNPGVRPPDKQPLSGPGSADYRHLGMRIEGHGEGAERFWLYEPAGHTPTSAPVIVFLHGWGAMTPDPYIEWLTHLCRRGNIVIYPKYQASLLEPSENFTPNAAKAINAALALLESSDIMRVRPQRENFALVGHSAGAVTCANLAARHIEFGLPQPRAVMPVQPGGQGRIPFADYSQIPEGCLLLCVFGDSDAQAGSFGAEFIFSRATAVAPADKNMVEFRSDNYGDEVLVADHFTPSAGRGEADFWDWFGYWKLFDGLTDAAFFGINREYALGDTPEQRFMGRFSDGRMVNELRVTLGYEQVTPNENFRPLYDGWGRPWRNIGGLGGALRDLAVHRQRAGQ